MLGRGWGWGGEVNKLVFNTQLPGQTEGRGGKAGAPWEAGPFLG